MLAEEGLVEIRHGRRNRLLDRPKGVSPAGDRLVALVAHEPLTHTTLTAYQGIAEMRAHLARHGFATEVLVCSARSAAAQQRKLAAFVRQNRVFCCVLVSVGEALQRWCAARGIPALVLGSCHAAVRLPSLDVDYRAVCRHAAGLLRAKGHRRLACLVPDSGLAGDLASETGFLEGCAGAQPPIDARIVRHDGTAAQLTLRLSTLFSQRTPPTALFVAKPVHTLATIAWLLRHGRRVPAEVSLVARDSDHLFAEVIAHYRFDDEAFAHRLTRLMTQLVHEGRLPPEPHLIFPRYVAGSTVAAI
jgi:LacI family transcriptional regulator